MKQLEKYKVILWDFDGVLLNSMAIRDLGFVKVLESYPSSQVDELLTYHRKNGGLSRYVKFRYFFNNIRNEDVSEEEILELASDFSAYMLNSLSDKKLLIEDSVSFVKENFENYIFHIVSGSDGVELRKICTDLNLSSYFKSIAGSPTAKIDLVKNLMKENAYSNSDVCLIGDSINDYDAAKSNDIDFFGYNNIELLENFSYIKSFFNND